MELKTRTGFPITFPLEPGSGCFGGVATDEMFKQNEGSCETRLTSDSNLEIGAGRQFHDAGLKLAKS
jgi:hypothetical protein